MHSVVRLSHFLALAGAFVLSACGNGASNGSQTGEGSVAPGQVTSERLLNIDEEPGAWLTGGRDFRQSYFSPLADINQENASDLGVAWTYDIDTEDGFEATPIVVDGVMYASGPKGAVYVLDAATGEELWTFQPEIDPDIYRKVCCGIVNRGLAVWRGKVYVASLDGYLYALDAATGDIAWKTDTITDRERGYTITGSPYVAGDLIVIGNSGAELDARGYITAYHHDSGKQAWRFFTVPGDPEKGFEHPELEMAAATWDPDSLWEAGLGGTVWDGMAYDPELDLLYVGTGNAAPYPRKLRSPSGGDNLFLSSILAINPKTGSLVWHYQTTPADNWDYTSTQKMILADLKIDGADRKVIMQAPKNGFFYVIDRVTGELISAKPYVPVNWATHVDKKSGRPIETGQGEYFDEPKLVFPSPAGGHNWQPMAFNPETGLVYIPTIEASAVFSMAEEPYEYRKGVFHGAAYYVFPVAGPWGLGGEGAAGMPPLETLAKGQPDTTVRGALKAWDPVRQKLVWRAETSGDWAGQMFATWNGGGVMTTAGGLVFQGRGTGDLAILDAKNGKEIHRVDLGTSLMAAPMSYRIGDTQYVAIMAGLGGAVGKQYLPGTAAHKYGNKGRIVALRLGGGAVPKRPLVDHRKAENPMPPVSRRGTLAEAEMGEQLFARNCSLCHANTGAAPDLTKMSAETHGKFMSIVMEGALEDRGMGSFSAVLSKSEAEAIHTFLIEKAWSTYEKQQSAPAPHRSETEGE